MTRTRNFTVCGLGLMGSAFARKLLSSKYAVTVWNRSPQRSEQFSGTASIATSATDAIRAGDVTISVLSNYAATEELLSEVRGELHNHTIINLATGAPADGRRLADLVTDAGGRYLDGAIEAYPAEIGRPTTLVYYSGSEVAWVEYRDVLLALAGQSRFVGADPGAANVLDAAMAGAFYNGALGAFHEGLAFAASSGLDLADLKSSVDYFIELLRLHTRESLNEVVAGNFTTDQAALDTYVEATQTWTTTMRDGGHRARILTAYLENLEVGARAGVGHLSLAAHTGALQNEDVPLPDPARYEP